MSPRRPSVLLGALLLAGAGLLSCGRSDLVDEVDPTASAGATGGAGGMGGSGGHGGSGGSTQNLGVLCTGACAKIIDCAPGTITENACVSQCVVGGMQICPNFSDIFSMTEQCLTRTSCFDFEVCLQAVPACQQ